MAADPVPRLRKIRERGSVILGELTRGSGAVAAERAWVGDLLLAVAPWGELEQSRYQPLNAFSKDEKAFAQEHVDNTTIEGLDHLNAITCHAVRMHRLEGLFRRIESATPAKPKARTGRKLIDDSAIIAAVECIRATQIVDNKSSAVDEALEKFDLSHKDRERARARILRRKL